MTTLPKPETDNNFVGNCILFISIAFGISLFSTFVLLSRFDLLNFLLFFISGIFCVVLGLLFGKKYGNSKKGGVWGLVVWFIIAGLSFIALVTVFLD